MYPDYLIHFNQNHSSKNGQFTSGDGDGDNIRDDHHNYAKNKGDLSDVPKSSNDITGEQIKKISKLLSVPARWIAGKAFAKTAFGQYYNSVKAGINYGKKASGFNEVMKGTNWSNYKKDQKENVSRKLQPYTDRIYDKAASFLNKYI